MVQRERTTHDRFTSKRIPAGIAVLAVLLTILAAALAIMGAWPFDTTSNGVGAEQHMVWEGQVALLAGKLYALDELPPNPRGCQFCLAVQSDVRGHPTLQAGNGVLGWPQSRPPTYEECIAQRNKEGTLNSVVLEAQHTSLSQISLHGWMCATSGIAARLMRLRYDGRQGKRYLFAVRSWARPPEG